MLIRYEKFFSFSEDIWTSLISVHRLDLRLSRCRLDLRAKIWCARSDFIWREERHWTILGEWLPGVRYLEVKMYIKARSGREKCPLFGV